MQSMRGEKLHSTMVSVAGNDIRAVSTLDLNGGLDNSQRDRVLIVHPGWGKAPEKHAALLHEAAAQGYVPIGVDTRRAQCSTPGGKTMDISALEARRSAALVGLCDVLEVGRRTYVGHSEGGRIATLAAQLDVAPVDRLLIVNSTGTAQVAGMGRLVRSALDNFHQRCDHGEKGWTTSLHSSMGSFMHFAGNLRRSLAEKAIIQNADIWGVLGGLASKGVDVTVMHAIDDVLISFRESYGRSVEHENVDFVPTTGGHSNVYALAVRSMILEAIRMQETPTIELAQ